MPISHSSSASPHWDCHARNLYFGETLILHFRRDALNQMHILEAFQELHWTPRIDDPLPPRGGVDRRERLHDAVKKPEPGTIPPATVFHAGSRWERRALAGDRAVRAAEIPANFLVSSGYLPLPRLPAPG